MSGTFSGTLVLVAIIVAVVVITMYVRQKRTRKPRSNKTPHATLPRSSTTNTQPLTSKTSTTPLQINTQITSKPVNTVDESERKLYQNLLRKALGDKAKVERLIQLETRKAPYLPRIELLQNVIDQWEQDNR